MKISSISITVARTFNLGNYESLRTEATTSVEIEDGDTPDAARERALSECRASLKAAYVEFNPKKGAGA